MKYICQFYVPINNNEGRYYALSACDKASYVFSVLNRLGHDVEVISASYARKFSKQRTDRLNEHVTVISGFSLGWNNRVTKILSMLSSMIWLLYYLLFRCKKNETIMIYHGVQNIPIYIIASFIKRFNYILEVEEFYSALSLKSGVGWRAFLEKAIIEKANSFIFASSQLEGKCNMNKKPFVIANGSYFVPEIISKKKDDGKIHLVYAGLIEKEKVAFKSAKIAKFLDERFIIHIIGYGNNEDIESLKFLISEINKTSSCLVQYNGLKRGQEYISFLQSCHIGICPLSSSKGFQMACFPSKITSYLSNGLLVLTTDNDVLKHSSYNKYLYFAPNDDPESFAYLIKTIDVKNSQNSRTCILEEDNRMLKEMPHILINNERV